MVHWKTHLISVAHIPGKDNFVAEFESRRNQKEAEFSIPQLHLIIESDPFQVCRFSRLVLFGEWTILLTTRQEEFPFVRFDEWEILCSIWHIGFSIRKLHLIIDNDPLQVCRFGRFVRFSERIIFFTTLQVEFPPDNCILLYWWCPLAFSRRNQKEAEWMLSKASLQDALNE